VGLLANLIRNEPQRFVTMRAFGLSSCVLPWPKVTDSGTLPVSGQTSRKAPLDLSIAKAQKGPWVFEVKYFKYTLFALIVPAAMRRQTSDLRPQPVQVSHWRF
jgi:hypothetical protein